MNQIILIVVLALVIGAVAWKAVTIRSSDAAPAAEPAGGAAPAAPQKISAEEVQAKLANPDAVILDVRSPGEYAEGTIPGSRFLPVQQLAARAEELPKDKEIIVYCLSGGRSRSAVRILREKGFTNVKDYSGGWRDWTERHLPVEKPKATP